VGDGQGAGVAGEDGFRAADLVEGPEHLVLEVEVLGDGLDDDVSVVEVLEGGGHAQAPEGLVLRALLELPPLDGTVEAALDQAMAPVAELAAHFTDPRLVTGAGRHLCDPAPHATAPQRPDLADFRHVASLKVACPTSILRRPICTVGGAGS